MESENLNENNCKKSGSRMKKVATKTCSLILCGAVFGTVSAASFVGVNRLIGDKYEVSEPQETERKESESSKEVTTVSYSSSDSQKNVGNLDVSEVASGMMPAMVSITNKSIQEVQNFYDFYGRGQIVEQETESSGTGFIIAENDEELLVVTNNHVVENSTTLTVSFVNEKVCEATIKGTDPDNDIAVIAIKLSDIDDDTLASIKIAKMGDSDNLVVGEQVVAIGNALGYGQSVTTGIVSATNRQVGTSDAAMIQTDAAINPGNSGGALLNMNGEVIGINSAKFSSTDVEGMGYAIAINTASPIIEELMNRETREKVPENKTSYIGITGEDITNEVSEAYGIPKGIYITAVEDDSPASDAGLPVNSIITHFDGVRVTSISSLQNRLEYYAAGERVKITVQVLEDGEYVEKTYKVTLGHVIYNSSSSSNSNSNQFFPFGN